MITPNLLSSVSLRPESDNDLPVLFDIFRCHRLHELHATTWDEMQKDTFLQMQFTLQRQAYRKMYSDGAFQLIVGGRDVIGRLYVAHHDDEIRIIDISLLPPYRDGGIGTQLLHQLIEQAHQQHKQVVLQVEKNNPAQHLYHRLGFEPIADNGVYLMMRYETSANVLVTPGTARKNSASNLLGGTRHG